MFWKRVRLTLEMIKFEHSIFALPFALTGALLAVRDGGLDARSLWVKFVWIVIAMVGARSAAMAFNRLVDAEIDGRNPRTRMRHIPARALSTAFGWGFVAVSSLIFIYAARELDLGALSLAGIVAVGLLLSYEHSLVKADDLSRVNAAFFTMNGWVSVLFFVFWAADVLLMRRA